VPNAFSFRHNVAAVVHAVDEVHVQMPALPEHHFIPLRHALVGMACRVLLSQVCLHLHDSPDEKFVAFLPDKIHSEQLLRDAQRRLKIE
jgi:hypothetical protein